MQNLTVSFSDSERSQVGDELSRLFNLQGEHFGDKRQAAFVDELADSGVPFGAVLAGIRSLVKENLTKIKIGTILEAAHRHIMPDEMGAACGDCFDGIVTMRDDYNRVFSIGCTCARGGDRSRSLRIARWTGEAVMASKGRTLMLIEKIITGRKGGE